MKYSFLYLLFFFTILTSYSQSTFDWQAHRGGRGIMPENSLPAFQKSLEIGVTTLELDVVITKDKQVIVSHEPFFSADICLDKTGQSVSSDKKQYNIYQFTYTEVQSFDCGSKGNKGFPEQQKLKVSKPLLSEVFQLAEKYCQEKKLPPVHYNIEIKSSPEGDNTFHPEVSEFSNLVYQIIKQYVPLERITLQCFDFRVLKYWKEKYPTVTLAALVANPRSVENNLADLGFTPQIYSPYYKLLLTKNKVENIHALGMKVIPWTVNEVTDMQRLKDWGVDGIITDYPNRIKEVK
ncbi:glycerophosphodiester phosphodiesterase [Xanthocytophaga agilis]|uniref:Glycerophosphodiester phosphodiesterase n=1 Tax=Xanthocytophaga agilis TaxID=3048010 RepID=A0AAE3RBP9_9BACT|nr:glycerophosphodiester phosphodiesterase [Xanthocytophaga agilis]MDJ1504533.1 glycerophosphodiester phosphodiesterase [Xanthocytophaga agilis]